jgi:hypothetical protein
VFGLTHLIASTVPDTPGSVKQQIQRENMLAREVLFESKKQPGGHRGDSADSVNEEAVK